MKKAVLISILVALAWPGYMRAQEADGYSSEFMGGSDEATGSTERADDGPRSIAEAKKQGRGYRIGSHGVHGGHMTPGGGRDVHVVQEGDTLWDISDHYYGDPWHWPE